MIKYQNYKGINILWAKEIPSHWHICRISSIFGIRREKNKPVRTKEVLSLSARYGVSLYSDRKEKGGNKPKEDFSSYNLCYPGDILVNCMNIVSGAVGISKYFGAVSPVYYPLVNLDKEKYDTRFMEYIFRNYNFQRGLVGIGKGIQMSEAEDGRLFTVRMRISWENLKVQMLIVPPLEEQRLIANFLDWKIREIDKLIDIEKQKIDELEKFKQKFIDEVFDSLSDYKHLRLSKLGNFKKGGGFSRANISNTTNEAILYGDIYTKYNYWFKECVTTIDKKGFNTAKHLNESAVLFTASGETKDDIGKTVAYIGKHKIAVGGDIIIYRVEKEFSVKYVSYYCNTSKIKDKKYVESTGEIIVHISSEVLKNIKIPSISIDEQNRLVKKIDNFIKLQNNIILIKNNIIDNYIKLKYSLISEVVTGQLDVRNVKIPERE